MIKHAKGDLFTASIASKGMLVHACNCEGRWGSGIAVLFRERFPIAHQAYTLHSSLHGHGLIGTSLICNEQEPMVGCLFTSKGYGKEVDSVAEILSATKAAISDLLSGLSVNADVHSPKFNSGLFKVPWEKTEAVLKQCLAKRPDVTWTVWDK